MTPFPELDVSVSICAGCGAETTAQETWVRLCDTLLCPDCHAAIGHCAAEAERSLSRAECTWIRLWREVYNELAGAA